MEIKKLIKSRKIWKIILGLVFVQVFFFLFLIYREGNNSLGRSNCKKELLEVCQSENNLSEKSFQDFSSDMQDVVLTELLEQSDYIQGYSDYIKSILEQSNSMNTVSIFSKTDSFSNKNLEQTKKDYERLENVQPVLFFDEYIEKFLNYSELHGFAFIAGLVIVLFFVEENKKGLRCMIFSTSNGRGKLVCSKIFALLCSAGLITILFYGIGYIESVVIYQGNLFSDMSYPIQSIRSFADFTWNMSIGEFFVVYFFYRWFILFLLMLLAWGILFCMDSSIPAFGVLGILGIIEFVLYKGVGASSPIQIVRYCNLWYLYTSKEVFTEYKNINVFSNLICKSGVIIGFLIVLFGLLFIMAYIMGTRKYPCASGKGIIKGKIVLIQRKIQKFYGRFLEKKSIVGMEWYKVIFFQKGWLVFLVLCFVFLGQSDFTSVQHTAQQEMYNEFIKKYEGLPSKEAEKYIVTLSKKISKIEEEYDLAATKYENGEMELYDLMEYTQRLQAFEQDKKFLEQIQEQTAYLKLLKQEKNIKGWYVNENSYNHLLIDGNKQIVENILFFIGVVLLCSGVFSFESKSGTKSIILGAQQGRRTLFWKKLVVAQGIMLVLFVFRTVLEWWNIKMVYGISGLNAPIQSIPVLSFVQLPCTIGCFFAFLYFVKLFVMVAVVCFVCMLSVRWSQKTTIALSVAACIPSVLYLAGIQMCKFASIVHLLNINQILLQVENVGILAILILGFAILGIVTLLETYKGWCPSNHGREYRLITK